MLSSRDYIHEIRKFTTSQYWYTGIRITAGVMLPTLVLEHYDWLAAGMPFLWGALFVSITDAPGPIHHRRNGLLAAVAFNTLTVLVTALVRDIQALLVIEIVLFGFFYSMFGIFGNRAGAIGTLALVIMMLNLVPTRDQSGIFNDTALIFAGGMWYTAFSLLLYRIRPYRLAEQAVGENLIAIADYFRARALLYKHGENIDDCFNGVMHEQSKVLKCQDQAREILFKTRQFVADASPRSRSTMMIFIDSVDLLEQVMSSYQDYQLLHRSLGKTGLPDKFYEVIEGVASELSRIGLIVQSGEAVKNDVTLEASLTSLEVALRYQRERATNADEMTSLHALEKTLASLVRISSLMQRLVLYTRLEVKLQSSYSSVIETNRMVIGQPITWEVVRENLSLQSNTFRHAVRLTVAMLAGYSVSLLLSLSHMYWVLLTIVTILRPVYSVSRQRNIHRVAGTLIGALIATAAIYFISDRTVLLVIMIASMIMSYSLLRMNYLGFVLFLTIYIIITFHFLNPLELTTLIQDRLIDTVIGSVIAALAARFVLPVWGKEEIENSLREMLKAHQRYFNAAWQALLNQTMQTNSYKLARKDAVVALTNLSDNFQRVLNEPKRVRQAEQLHQFVIANHILAGHLAALAREKIPVELLKTPEAVQLTQMINAEFSIAETELSDKKEISAVEVVPELTQPQQLSLIYSLVREMRMMSEKISRR